MKRILITTIGLACCLGMDCQGNPPAGSMVPGTNTCRVTDAPGFTIDFPCEAQPVGLMEMTDGILYGEVFRDDQGNAFGLEVVSAAALQSGMTGASIGSQGNLWFNGTFRTVHGDHVVLATIRLDVGDIFRALTFLADGSLLRVDIVSESRTRDQNLITLGSLNLANTDGAGVLTLLQDQSSRMLAPFDNTYIIFEDASVWRIDPANRLRVAGWSQQDPIFALSAERLGRDAFLTQIPEWVSIPVDFVGIAELLQVVSITPVGGCTDVELSDGTVWTACTDRAILDALTAGENVAVFGQASGGALIMRLSNGRTALVVS